MCHTSFLLKPWKVSKVPYRKNPESSISHSKAWQDTMVGAARQCDMTFGKLVVLVYTCIEPDAYTLKRLREQMCYCTGTSTEWHPASYSTQVENSFL